MIEVPHFRDRKVAVLGLGRSGLSAAAALKAGGAEIIAWDDGPSGRAAGMALFLGVEEGEWRDPSDLPETPGTARARFTQAHAKILRYHDSDLDQAKAGLAY